MNIGLRQPYSILVHSVGLRFFFFYYYLPLIISYLAYSSNFPNGFLYNFGMRLFKNILVNIIINITVVFNTIPQFLLYYQFPPNSTLENNANGVAPLTKPLIINIIIYYFFIVNFFENSRYKPTTISTFTVRPIIRIINTHKAKMYEWVVLGWSGSDQVVQFIVDCDEKEESLYGLFAHLPCHTTMPIIKNNTP